MTTEACGLVTNCVKKPAPGAVLSPWVRVKFKKAGRTISVGNESYHNNRVPHSACIKDFEFGHENGLGCRVTIHDEQGGGFAEFMKDLIMDLSCEGGEEQNMDVQFGWTASNCDESDQTPIEASPVYLIMCREVVCSFSNGKFMYEITGTDISETMFETANETIQGGDGDDELYLTDAIEKMMKDTTYPPVIQSVQWKQMNGIGSCRPQAGRLRFDLSDDIEKFKGPKGKWEADSENKIQAAIKWLTPYLSERKKSIVPHYNSQEESEIIFWEDFQPNCEELGRNWDVTSHGTYIVNGGENSSVLEFSPRIRWNWSTLTNVGGGSSDTAPTGNENGGKQPGFPDCSTINSDKKAGAGSTTSVIVDENAAKNHGDSAFDKVGEGQARMLKALKVFHYGIEADLVVVGEPKAIRPIEGIFNMNLHIVLINPYFVNGGLDNGVPNEWLAKPLCNEVLTNKAWLIRNITHRIQDGRFTTVFGVYLAVPGVDIEIGQPIGGANSGGWVPPGNC